MSTHLSFEIGDILLLIFPGVARYMKSQNSCVFLFDVDVDDDDVAHGTYQRLLTELAGVKELPQPISSGTHI
jgi:hypothetical protein